MEVFGLKVKHPLKIFPLKTKVNLHFLPLIFLPSLPNEKRVGWGKQMSLVVGPCAYPSGSKEREALGGKLCAEK